MKFKQAIRLVCLAVIFIMVSSALVLLLPEEFIGTTEKSQVFKISGIHINFDISGYRQLLANKLGGLIQKSETTQQPAQEIPQVDIVEVDTSDYYASAQGLTGDALKSALHEIIDDHHELDYSEVWDALKEIDEDPNNSSNVILIYTGRSQSKNTNGTGRDDWNREHIWAKSHGDFGTKKGAGTDLHHIKPADVTVNSSRNNKNFDESLYTHKEATLCHYDKDSFEPRDEVKGDVARMMFYMAVRYEGGGEPDLELVEYMNSSKKPFHGKLSTFLKWNEEDPVSAFEIRRNELIYEKYQGNRNPFIDHPEWADLIFEED